MNLLDDLARSAASGISRRRALGRLGGAFGASILGVLGLGRKAWAGPPTDCSHWCQQFPGPQRAGCKKVCDACSDINKLCGTSGRDLVCCNGTCCSGTCTDLSSDVLNCGACGKTCPAGKSCCGGLCINTQTDFRNCGACGNVCGGPFPYCAAGVCGEPPCSALCDHATFCCGSVCCSPGQLCTAGPNGQLFCAPDCPGGQICQGVCVNIQTDNANCGACGNVCAAGTTCTAGSCAASCPAGQTSCGGVCVNTQNDNANCGACGNVCAAGTTCTAGSCASCPVGQTSCGGVCVNTQFDIRNCGACGNVCRGQHPYCTAGVCGAPPCDTGMACARNEFCCGSECCHASEVCTAGPAGPACAKR